MTAVPAGAVIDAVAFAVADLPSGATLAGQLNVSVNANASTSISALAVAGWAASAGGAAQSTPSNTLVIALPVIAAGIGYFTSASYVTASVSGAPGSPLFVQVNAAVCNTNPAQVLTVPVTLTSRLTGDVDTFNAVETAANTGAVPHPAGRADGERGDARGRQRATGSSRCCRTMWSPRP